MIRLITLALTLLTFVITEPVIASHGHGGKSEKNHKIKSAKKHKIESEKKHKIKKAEWRVKKEQLRVQGKSLKNIEVRLLNAVDGSLMAAIDADSDDHFSFRIPIDGGVGVPCAVIVEQGSASVQMDVEDAPANCGRKLTIAGQVVDAPIAFAIVQFTIAGQVFSTIADANGFYQIDIVTATTDTLVIADATVPGTSGLTLTSIIGPVSSLLSDANANGVIDSTGTFSTNITNVTTANVALMTQANGGQPITNLAQLQQAEKFVDATELLRIAAVIRLIIDDPAFSLPAGFDNLLAFTSDPIAINSFVAAVDPTLFDVTLTAILNDANILPGFDAGNIPDKYYAITTPVAGFLSRTGDALEFDQNGTGNLLSTDTDGRPINDAYTWQVVDGVLKLVFISPTDNLDFPAIENTTATAQQILDFNCCANSSLIRRTTTLDRDYVLLQNGVLEEKVSAANRVLTTFDPIAIDDNGDGNTDRFIQLAESFEIQTSADSLRDSSQIDPIAFDTALPVTGSWAFQFDYDLGTSGFTGFIGEGIAVDLLTFNADGTGSTKIAHTAFTWSTFQSGRVLTLEYLSPSNESITEQIRLLDELNGLHGAFYEFTNNVTGIQGGTYAWAVRQDPSFVFSLPLMQTAPGMFWNADALNGMNKDQWDENGQLKFTSHFGWGFNNPTDATNYTFFLDVGGNTLLDRDMAWDILANGDLFIEGGYFNFCINQLQIRCHTRTWTPLFQDSTGGIFFLEEGRSDFSGTVPPVTRHGRPRLNGVHKIMIPAADDFRHRSNPPI